MSDEPSGAWVLVPADPGTCEGDDSGFLLAFLGALHSHLPEDEQPSAWMQFSDDQRDRIKAAYRAMIVSAEPSGGIFPCVRRQAGGRRPRRFNSRSTACRMSALASSSPVSAARMRSIVPAANEVRNFSGHSSFLPITHIRYVDNGGTIAHIRYQSKETLLMAGRRGNPDWAQHRVAKALGESLGTWVDPCCVKLFPARGYWAHTHQDCQRWTGNVEVEGTVYTLGSWGMTVSAIKMGERFEVHDHRREERSYSDFSFERPERATQ